jgi:SSS family solute:Na+ symporter
MFSGLIVASLQFVLDKNKAHFTEGTLLCDLSRMQAIYLFPIILVFSSLGCILGTFLSKPTDIEVLKSFYTNVRPWGWWKPVYKVLKSEDQTFEKNNDFAKDMLNCLIGIVWQSSMIVLPIFFIIRDNPKTIVSLIVFLVTSTILKFTWLDKVRKITN